MTEVESKPSSDRFSAEVLEWLMRSYKTQERWKNLARRVFFLSNGDSVLSRNRVAAKVRMHFVEGKPKEEDVEVWEDTYEGTKETRVKPPAVSASNAGYVDWLFIADYLLLPCASPIDQYVEENQRRESEFQQLFSSYQIRLHVHEARRLIQEQPSAEGDEILDSLKKEFDKASLANVKEARRLETLNAPGHKPPEPQKPHLLPLYTPVYFPNQNL